MSVTVGKCCPWNSTDISHIIIYPHHSIPTHSLNIIVEDKFYNYIDKKVWLMLVLDYIIYVFYRLVCADPFWNTMPYLGCSFFLSIPISLLIDKLLKAFGIGYNTLYILICFFVTWVILYPFMEKNVIGYMKKLKTIRFLLNGGYVCFLIQHLML